MGQLSLLSRCRYDAGYGCFAAVATSSNLVKLKSIILFMVGRGIIIAAINPPQLVAKSFLARQ